MKLRPVQKILFALVVTAAQAASQYYDQEDYQDYGDQGYYQEDNLYADYADKKAAKENGAG